MAHVYARLRSRSLKYFKISFMAFFWGCGKAAGVPNVITAASYFFFLFLDFVGLGCSELMDRTCFRENLSTRIASRYVVESHDITRV